MTPLRQRMQEELSLKDFSPNTRRSYLRSVTCLAKHFGKSPDQLNSKDLRQYFLYLFDDSGLSSASIDQHYWGLRFFFEQVLSNVNLLDNIKCPKVCKRLPVILSHDEVKRFFDGITSIKYQAMLMIAYDTGLRVSEIAKLQVQHIDGKRKLVRVQQGKGRKDRYVRLSEQLLLVLREYWKSYKPKEWLFPGQDPANHWTFAKR